MTQTKKNKCLICQFEEGEHSRVCPKFVEKGFEPPQEPTEEWENKLEDSLHLENWSAYDLKNLKEIVKELLASQRIKDIKKGESWRLGYEQGIKETKEDIKEKVEELYEEPDYSENSETCTPTCGYNRAIDDVLEILTKQLKR